jgi:hypothetical protein
MGKGPSDVAGDARHLERGAIMSVSSIGAGAAFAFRVATAGTTPDPSSQHVQVNAQADLLQALMGIKLPAIAAAQLSDGTGVDLYM